MLPKLLKAVGGDLDGVVGRELAWALTGLALHATRDDATDVRKAAKMLRNLAIERCWKEAAPSSITSSAATACCALRRSSRRRSTGSAATTGGSSRTRRRSDRDPLRRPAHRPARPVLLPAGPGGTTPQAAG
ncbi:MAG: hypothetical protein R3F43_11350 [bacterium]